MISYYLIRRVFSFRSRSDLGGEGPVKLNQILDMNILFTKLVLPEPRVTYHVYHSKSMRWSTWMLLNYGLESRSVS